jgi:hypothetical protein
MPVYTTDGRVIAELPDNLPDGVDTADERAQYLADAATYVDGALVAVCGLASGTQCFPDYTATPATPPVVVRAATLVAAAMIAEAMGLADNLLQPVGNGLWARAEKILADVREGRVVVMDSAGTQYRATEIRSTTQGAAPVFTRGQFDADGNLLGDAGSLDGLTS